MNGNGLLFLIQTKLPSAHSWTLMRLDLKDGGYLLVYTKATNGLVATVSSGQWFPNLADNCNHLIVLLKVGFRAFRRFRFGFCSIQ